MRYGVLLVGLGQMGMGYDLNLDPSKYIQSHSRALQIHPDFDFFGAVDISERRRLVFENSYNLPSFPNISLALKTNQPDIVIVSTPTDTHLKTIQEIFKSGCPRAILCEKPLANDIKTADQIVKLSDAHNCQLYVNFTRRADPAVKEVKKRISDGRILSPIKGVAWYSKGMLNNGSHLIDLIRYWLGPVSSSKLISAGRFCEDDLEPDVSIEFQRGVVSFFAAREEDFSYFAVELVSASGRLRYDCGGENVSWQSAVMSQTNGDYRVLDFKIESLSNEADIYQYKILEELSAALKRGTSNLCTGNDALRVNEIISGIKGLL